MRLSGVEDMRKKDVTRTRGATDVNPSVLDQLDTHGEIVLDPWCYARHELQENN